MMPEIQALLNVLNWELCVILRLSSPGALAYRAVKAIPWISNTVLQTHTA